MTGQTEKWLVITGHGSLFAALLRLLQQKNVRFQCMFISLWVGV